LRRYLAGPLYLLLLCGLVLILFSLSGLLEFRRTEQGLRKILEDQGIAYLDSQEKEIRPPLSLLSALEQNRQGINPPLPPPFGDLLGLDSAIAEHLMEVALDLDRREREGRLDPSQLSRRMKAEKLKGVEFWDFAGNLRLAFPGGGPHPLDRSVYQVLLRGQKEIAVDDLLRGTPLRPHYTLGIKRHQDNGILLLSLTGSRMQSLRLQLLLESARGSQALGGGLRYLIFQGEDPFFLTPGESFPLEGIPADTFLTAAKREGGVKARTFKTPAGEEVYEVVRTISSEKGEAALLRVGLSLQATRAILSQLKASILLHLSLLAAFGIIATLAVFWMQNRHLLHLREMEDKIQMAERLSSLGQLAAGLAHEIRNPLNAISMGIQRLQRESVGSLESPETAGLLELIRREIARLNALVERFLGLSRPDRIRRERGDLGSILSELLRLFSEQAKEKGIQLSFVIPPDLPPVFMDQEKIREAFLNLIKNGMEAMNGGGLLRVEAHRLDEQRLEVCFSDSGCGIPASELHKVFDPYYTSKEHGMGLGLSLAYQIIRSHGGEIHLESELGKGSRFLVVLPYGEGGKEG